MSSISNQADNLKENISFVTDIQMMMFGLGDNPAPLQSTAIIVEKVVLQQLGLILGQAEEVAERRGVDGIHPQDILFLVRKDLAKLNRIISYITMKDVKKNFANITSTDVNSVNIEELTDDRIYKSKRKHVCLTFLQTLGVELEPVDDTLKLERLSRIDNLVQNMSVKMFFEHQQARRAAFANADNQFTVARFLEWLQQGCPESAGLVAKLKSFAVDMLVYLAKETIAVLIDLALVLRRDANLCPTDPLSRAEVPHPCESFPPPPNKVVEGPPPITADEIREVLRRFYSPQLNPWSPFTCNIDPAISNKIMAS